MSKIRPTGTKFEKRFVNELKKRTQEKFKTNVKEIKGRPDLVFKRRKICVFLDSDFWHGWQYPRWKNALKNDFWHDKIENTRKRDRRVTLNLRKKGWKVIRVWEHAIKKDFNECVDKVLLFLE